MRLVPTALAGIAVLTGGAIWFVSTVTRPAPSGGRGEVAGAAGTSEGAAGPATASPARQRSSAGGEDEAAAAQGAGMRAPGDPEAEGQGSPNPAAAAAYEPPLPLLPWSEVRTSRLNAIRGPERDAVMQGMALLEDDLKACTQEKGHPVGAPLDAVEGGVTEGDDGRTVLQLALEARGGQIVIVGAPVLVRGDASDGLVACVQRRLAGHAMPAPNARPNWRQRVRFPVGR